jgi:tRNA A-37 threonylcarbamoyl transferase component Bud32
MAGLIGQSIGRYQILEQLGEGGMATVYKAYDTILERYAAIKVIRTDQFAPSMLDEMMKRFEREAKALARLSHPSIVHVYDYGEFGGAPYLVMEYVPSGTLKERPDKPVPWERALQIILPVARALAYAHEHNVIHRDIKPGNILLTEAGQPMLSDFGIAKIVGSNEGATLTGAGTSIGTPEYMAPEQWTGESSPQADIYSLGVVLYELVTGRKPYTADTPVGVMLKQVNEPLPRPRQFIPDLPMGLEDTLVKAMQREPRDRYPNMGEFVAALEGLTNKPAPIPEKKVGDFPTGKTLLASQPEPQPPVEQIAGSTDIPPAGATPPLPPDQPLPRPGKRNRWIPVGIVAVLLCLGVVIATIFIVKGFVNRNLVAAQNSTRTGGQPTQLVSQGQPTSTPHAQVKVLWDTSHGPRTSPAGGAFTPEGMYKTLVQVLGKDQFTVTSGDLSNLDSYAVLVISETSGSTPYSDAEVSQIEQFVRTGGHGLLILSDTPDIENLADPLSRKFSIALGELTTDGPSNINSTEKFFSDVNSIQFLNGGGIFQVSAPAQTASTDRNGNTVIAFCSCDSGRVLAIADTNLWDNQGVGQADNQRFALNAFQWLGKVAP